MRIKKVRIVTSGIEYFYYRVMDGDRYVGNFKTMELADQAVDGYVKKPHTPRRIKNWDDERYYELDQDIIDWQDEIRKDYPEFFEI